MPLFNTILIVLLAGFVLYGLWFGLIHTLGSLIGTVVGALAAGQYYDIVAHWLQGWLGGSLNVHRAIAFLLIFAIVNRLVGFAFLLIEKTFNFISIIPFLKSINRLLGGVLGLIEGAIVLGATLYIIQRFPFGGLPALIDSSPIAKTLLAIARVIIPLLPESIRNAVGIPTIP